MQQDHKEQTETLTPEQEELVFVTLQNMLESTHFSKSKRYPALLQYVVAKTIAGDHGALKERIIGAQLFGRPADYDTSSDPVVRVVLNELRKRLAIYNSEHPEQPVLIDLPIGSYGAQFTFCKTDAVAVRQEAQTESQEQSASMHEESLPVLVTTGRKKSSFFRVRADFAIAAAVIAVAVILLVAAYRHNWRKPCGPLCSVQNSGYEALIVLGKTLDSKDSPVLSLAAELQDDRSSRHKVSLGSTMAVADICSVLGTLHKPFQIRPADKVFMSDLYGRPVVLVGEANSNPWIERLQESLRYQIVPGTNGRIEIVDRKSAGNNGAWSAQIDSQTQAVFTDYAILAKFHSATTDSDVVLLGGLNGFGVSSAAVIATSAESFRTITASAPKGWHGDQFEVVVRTDVLQGHPGHVQVVAADFWN